MMKQVHDTFGDVESFDPAKKPLLLIELAITGDVGEAVVKAT